MIVENKTLPERKSCRFTAIAIGQCCHCGEISNSSLFLKVSEYRAVQLMTGGIKEFDGDDEVVSVNARVEWWY